MTDEQIIKALRYCNGVNCENCKALDFCDYQHPGRLARCAYAVIRRRQSKIEREVNQIKSEAIKEFAERLKEIIYTHENRVDVDGIVLLTRIDSSIDNLVKEMTEVDK